MAWEMVGPHMACCIQDRSVGLQIASWVLWMGAAWDGGWAMLRWGWVRAEFGERSCSQEKL